MALCSVGFAASFLDDARAPEELRRLDPGGHAVAGGAVARRISPSQLRLQRLDATFTPSPPPGPPRRPSCCSTAAARGPRGPTPHCRLSADLWFYAPALRGALALTGLAAAALFGLLLRASWPREDHRTRQHLTWLLVGSAGSLLPVAATFPSDRLALAASLGPAAALATIFLAGLEALRRGGRRLVVAGAGLLALAHLLLAPLYGLAIQAALIDLGRKSVAVAQHADLGPPPERFDAIVLSAPDHVVGIYAPLQLERDAAEVLRSWRPLSLAPHDHRVTRVDERTVDLEVIGGSMMTSLFERLYRSPDAPLVAGETLDRGLLRVRILAANAAGPTRVRFVFERSLDDPSLRLLVWRDGRLQRIAPPAIGASITITREPGPGG